MLVVIAIQVGSKNQGLEQKLQFKRENPKSEVPHQASSLLPRRADTQVLVREKNQNRNKILFSGRSQSHRKGGILC